MVGYAADSLKAARRRTLTLPPLRAGPSLSRGAGEGLLLGCASVATERQRAGVLDDADGHHSDPAADLDLVAGKGGEVEAGLVGDGFGDDQLAGEVLGQG